MLLAFLFLLFTVVPVVELSLLLYLATSVLGWLPTLALVIVTGVVGVVLARWQGTRALLRIQRRLSRGQLPADDLFDQVLILMAGLLLVIPGILTDLVGFSLLIPPIRGLIKRYLRAWAKRQVDIRVTQATTQFWPPIPPPHHPQRDEVIDIEVIESRVVE